MKLTKNKYLVVVKIQVIPMHAISSDYYNKVRVKNSDEDSRKMKQAFEDGYIKAYKHLGLSDKLLPKGKRG